MAGVLWAKHRTLNNVQKQTLMLKVKTEDQDQLAAYEQAAEELAAKKATRPGLRICRWQHLTAMHVAGCFLAGRAQASKADKE